MSTAPALQLSTSDSMFVVMVIVAASFLVMAAAMVAIAVAVFRVVRTVNNLERRAEPLIERVGALSVQVQQIAEQGKEVGEQVSLMSGHLSVASEHFAATTALVREEVRELRQLVGYTAVTAKEQVERVSQSVEQANRQFSNTVSFINLKLVRPARELAALMAGVRRGLEVLAAPAPKQIDQTYGEEEMFIG
jgi:phage shock protein A